MRTLDILAAVLVLGGSTLALTAAIGVVRFPDTLTRMHAATKPQVLGLLLVLIGPFVRDVPRMKTSIARTAVSPAAITATSGHRGLMPARAPGSPGTGAGIEARK